MKSANDINGINGDPNNEGYGIEIQPFLARQT
jgi:hypothetical protein